MAPGCGWSASPRTPSAVLSGLVSDFEDDVRMKIREEGTKVLLSLRLELCDLGSLNPKSAHQSFLTKEKNVNALFCC